MELNWTAEEKALMNIKKIITVSQHLDGRQLWLLYVKLQKKQTEILPGQIGMVFLKKLKWISAREKEIAVKAWPGLKLDTERMLKLISVYQGMDKKLWLVSLSRLLEPKQDKYFKTELGHAFILVLKEKLGIGMSGEKQNPNNTVYPSGGIRTTSAVDLKELEKIAAWLMEDTNPKKKKEFFLFAKLKKAAVPVLACLSASFMIVWLYGQVVGNIDRWKLEQMKMYVPKETDVVLEDYSKIKDGYENVIENFKDENQLVKKVKIQGKLQENSYPKKLAQYKEMSKKYPQLYGWIKIPGTQIDFPVMKPKGEKEFYLYHDFAGVESAEGSLFVDVGSNIYPQDDNTVIYGHNMKNGHMFGTLQLYEDEVYFQTHRKIYFDTIYEEGTYEAVAVLKTRLLNENEEGFRYYRFFQYDNEKEFQKCQKFVEQNKMFDTGNILRYGDKMLMLSTCEYSQENGRLVVVARKL